MCNTKPNITQPESKTQKEKKNEITYWQQGNMVEPESVDSQFLKEVEKPDIENENYRDSSSSSDSEFEKSTMLHSSGKNRLFGRQKPLHLVLGGGQSADVILWRNKKASGSIFCGVTIIWLLFACVGYPLLTFVCHSLILTLASLFVWAKLASFINVRPPDFPEVILPEDLLVKVLLGLRAQIILVITAFRDVASGKDLKKFLMVVLALWILGVIGNWLSFLTLSYLVIVMMQILPVLYEKHEDTVDNYAEKGWIEIKKQYAVLDEKVLQKIPIISGNKDHKQH